MNTHDLGNAEQKWAQLVEIAHGVAASIPDFQTVRGPGLGDHATSSFMKRLRERALASFGADFSESRLCGETAFATDFFFPDEATVVEVALGLPNPASEFEKDVLKALMAREHGHDVRRLAFISRAGAIKKCQQPGRAAVVAWALANHNLVIEVYELGGEPRRRIRRRA